MPGPINIMFPVGCKDPIYGLLSFVALDPNICDFLTANRMTGNLLTWIDIIHDQSPTLDITKDCIACFLDDHSRSYFTEELQNNIVNNLDRYISAYTPRIWW